MSKKRPGAARSGRRGRPPKYGRPGQVVALTLPRGVIQSLLEIHSDLGWAIVTLVEKTRRAMPSRSSTSEAELVEIGDGQFLIVINSSMLHSLPGVRIVPLSATQAFLAIDPGQGVADLELAVLDRLQHLKAPSRERRAVVRLGDQLRKWRRDARLQFHSESIIVVAKRPPAGAGNGRL